MPNSIRLISSSAILRSVIFQAVPPNPTIIPFLPLYGKALEIF
ncbi:MAG: hypothetical protein WCP69_15010 [Bacteroidota bacterium]